MATETQTKTTEEQIAEKVGWGLTDRLSHSARLAERERCGKMLAEYIAQGRTPQEVVAYATALLRTDY